MKQKSFNTINSLIYSRETSGAQLANSRKNCISKTKEATDKVKDRISSLKKQMEGLQISQLSNAQNPIPSHGDSTDIVFESPKAGSEILNLSKMRSPVGKQPTHQDITQSNNQLSQQHLVVPDTSSYQIKQRNTLTLATSVNQEFFQPISQFQIRGNMCKCFIYSYSHALIEQKIINKTNEFNKAKSLLHANQIELQQRIRKRQQLNSILADQRQNSVNLQAKIKVQLQQVYGKLEKMNIYKKRQNLNQKQTSNKLEQKIKAQTQSIAKLALQKEQIEKCIKQTKQQGEEMYTKKMQQAEDSWQPIEQAIRTVEAQKEKQELKVEQCEADYNQLYNIRNMLHQDIVAHQIQYRELLIKKKQLKTAMNDFKLKHEHELTVFFQELQFKRDVQCLQNQKKNLNKRLVSQEQQKSKIMKELADHRNIISAATQNLKQVQQNQKVRQLDNQILQMEQYMNAQALQNNAPTLQEIISDVIRQRGIDVESQIQKRQLQLIDDAEMDELIGYSQMNKELKEKIEQLSNQVMQLSNRTTKQNKEENTHAIQFRSQEIQELKSQIKCLSIQHEFKLKELQKWKKQLRKPEQQHNQGGQLLLTLQSAWQLNKQVIEEIFKRLVALISSEQQKNTMKQLVEVYSKKISEREGDIQRCMLHRSSYQEKITTSKQRIQTQEQRLQISQTQITAVKSELANLEIRQQAIKKLIDQRKSQLQFASIQNGEANFQKYMKENQEIFSNVKRTYGAKVAEKMKMDQKKQFANVNSTQLKKRRAKLQQMHQEILVIDRALDRNSMLVNEELSDLSMQTQARLSIADNSLTKVQNQMVALTDAQQELVNQLESVVSKKKDALLSSVQNFFKTKKLEKNQKKLKEIEAVIENKQIELQSMESSSTDVEKIHYDTHAQISLQANDLRIRLNQLNQGLEQIKTKVKGGLVGMEKEIQQLNFDITGMKKKSQGLHDKVLGVKRELDVARNAMVDKFGQEALHDLPLPVSTDLGMTQQETLQLIVSADDQARAASVFASTNEKQQRGVSNDGYKEPEEFRPTKIDANLPEEKQMQQQYQERKYPDENKSISPNQESKLKEHFSRQQLSPTPHTFIHLVRLKYFPTITLQLQFDDLLPNQAALLDSLKPLLGGVEVFRKLLTSSGINSRKFDPSKNRESNPEILGYAFRTLRVVPELTHFEIRKIDKLQHVQGVFELSDFVKQDIHPNSKEGLKKQTSMKKAEIKYQAFNWVFRNIAVDLVVMNDSTIKVITKAAANLLKANKALIEKISSRIRSLEEE